MHPAEAILIQIAKHVGMTGMQASQAFNAAQAQLQLAEVLSQSRLATSEGVLESLATLERLRKLTEAHKELFQRFVAAAAQQLSSAIAELPQDRREELQTGMVESINLNLASQGEFYAGREHWVAVASELCRLVESRRDSIEFRESGLVFASDADFERFTQLVSAADEIHRSEAAQMNDRASRLAQSMAVLGAAPP